MKRQFIVLIIAMVLVFQAVSTVSAHQQTHVVQYRDTLSSIAVMYGVSMYDLQLANNIINPNYIQRGQRLHIPDYGHHVHCDTFYHYVSYGETLGWIARWYGVSVNDIIAVNPGIHPNWIYAGQWIMIPSCW